MRTPRYLTYSLHSRYTWLFVRGSYYIFFGNEWESFLVWAKDHKVRLRVNLFDISHGYILFSSIFVVFSRDLRFLLDESILVSSANK